MKMDKDCLACGKNEGTVRIQTIIGPIVEEVWLCRKCADRYGIDDREPAIEPRTADLLAALLRPRPPKRRKRKTESEEAETAQGTSQEKEADGGKTPENASAGNRQSSEPPSPAHRRKNRAYWGDDVPANARECPSCGLTLARLKKTGRMGCFHCYSDFRRIVEDAMSDQSMSPRHDARLTERLLPYRYLYVDRERLKSELAGALEKEEYERAEQIRAQMATNDGNQGLSDADP